MDVLKYSSGQYRQAFTRKSNKPCRFQKFQENTSKVCKLMERCDGHGGDVKVLWEV